MCRKREEGRGVAEWSKSHTHTHTHGLEIAQELDFLLNTKEECCSVFSLYMR